jgi:hypothetical protein
MGDKRSAYWVLVRKGGLRKREHLEDIGVDGRTIMIMDIQEEGEERWTGVIWLRIETGVRVFVNAE